jgi:DNA-binding PadR family transcriptional regulator
MTRQTTSHRRQATDPLVREFLLGFWKIHILHHAEEEEGIYGQWMLEELRHHGYRLSPGTLYPVLARMAQRGWLKASEPKRARDARVYRITPAGAQVLEQLRSALDELQREVSSDGDSHSAKPTRSHKARAKSKAAELPVR